MSIARFFLILIALLTGSAARAAPRPVTILISIDGFRADYLERGLTPTLAALARHGLNAAMRPAFPAITFPNHEAIVTGLTPDRSGIVHNTFEVPGHPGVTFTQAKSDDAFWWAGAEPIWVAAERAGIRTATLFWPGSQVAHDGIRPSDWQHYDKAISGEQRVAAVIDWLRRPAGTRPRFVTLYFDIVDTAGHTSGPDSPELAASLRTVDRQIATLCAGLAALGQPANLVIVADHGMAASGSARAIMIDTIADRADFRVITDGPATMIAPVAGHEDRLARALLAPHAHVHCWRREEVPARFHYGTNPRVAPFVCLADTGWQLRDTIPAKGINAGDHGYDNDAPEMRALFIAQGPAVARGRRLPVFDIVDVYALLRDLIGLPPKPGIDGSDAPFRGMIHP